MKLEIEKIDDVAKCVFDDKLPYNVTVAVPSGIEAVYVRGGATVAVLHEGETLVNEANLLKAAFTRCKESSQLYAVNRARQFRVLWGTGGIGFYDKTGALRTAGSCGSYQFTVDNAQALLRKFGYPSLLTQEDVKDHMKGMVAGVVKEQVIAAFEKDGYNVGGKTAAIQRGAQARLEKVFADYGLFLDVMLIDEVTDTYEGGNGEE